MKGEYIVYTSIIHIGHSYININWEVMSVSFVTEINIEKLYKIF